MSETATQGGAHYGLLGRFDDAETLVAAIRALRDEGHAELEAFSPYPIEELSQALGFRSRWLTVGSLAAALLAATAGYGMMWYSSAIDYPFVVGGKPLHGWPPFALIAFVLAILAAALTAVLGMLFGNRLPRPYHPAFNADMFERASGDAYFLLVNVEALSRDDTETLRSRLTTLGANEVQEVPP
ncbi:DUF3341 domain-containing protein [Litchfieldella rifensis]|uniref:DUF3341 domain-containing protein n=1 Tax=Litchfieldella rifensis TaxID=762643 RepID=A0ABV7LLX8_9GAMM